ncbi:MAG: YdcF family protein [Opitutaceae bacterium]|nr:YdcF family protein [Opitutaceae bacterium]
MLFLHKLLPVFVLPLGLVLLLLAIALWRGRRWPVAAALGLLYAASIPFTGDRLIGGLESRHAAVAWADAPAADAVVVLGGIFGPPAPPGFAGNVAEPGERLEAGIRLWAAGRAPLLVFTGGRIPGNGREVVEGELCREEAGRRGVPAAAMLVTAEVGNTADEARAVAALVRERGWKRVILVTTGWHMPRARLLFGRTGAEVVPFPVDFRRDRSRPLTALDFVPKADALANTETALREAYGWAFYWAARRVKGGAW